MSIQMTVLWQLHCLEIPLGVAYRQLQGIIEDCLGEEGDSPKFSAIYKRINKIKLEERNGKSWFVDGKTKTEIVFLAGDSTGLKPTSRGDWMGEKKWNIRRRWIHQDACDGRFQNQKDLRSVCN